MNLPFSNSIRLRILRMYVCTLFRMLYQTTLLHSCFYIQALQVFFTILTSNKNKNKISFYSHAFYIEFAAKTSNIYCLRSIFVLFPHVFTFQWKLTLYKLHSGWQEPRPPARDKIPSVVAVLRQAHRQRRMENDE